MTGVSEPSRQPSHKGMDVSPRRGKKCWVKHLCGGWASHVALVVKKLPASAEDVRDMGSIPGSGRLPGGVHGNPLQCSCLENPHGQRSLAGCSPWGHKESDMNGTTWHVCMPALLSDLDVTQICSSRECDYIFGCDYILIPVGLTFVFAHLAISPNMTLGSIFGIVFVGSDNMCCQWWDRFRKCREDVSFVSQRNAEINECGCQFVPLITAPKKRKRFIT